MKTQANYPENATQIHVNHDLFSIISNQLSKNKLITMTLFSTILHISPQSFTKSSRILHTSSTIFHTFSTNPPQSRTLRLAPLVLRSSKTRPAFSAVPHLAKRPRAIANLSTRSGQVVPAIPQAQNRLCQAAGSQPPHSSRRGSTAHPRTQHGLYRGGADTGGHEGQRLAG